MWENKRILFMGDSITALGTAERGWVGYFNDIIKPSHFINVAVSGATIEDKDGTVYDGNPIFDPEDTLQSGNVLGNQLEKVIVEKNKCNSDYEDFDYIIIAAGTNVGHRIGLTENETTVDRQFFDSLGNKISLEKVNRKTWAGAMRYVYENLRLNYPNAKIFFCSPIQAAESVDRAYLSIKAKGALIKAVCDRLSDVIFIDTFNCGICGFYESKGENGRDLIDGLHPNINGAKKIAEYNVRAVKWHTM